VDTQDRHLFFNRELSWLAFNERVLDEAMAGAVPLHERLKFLSISAANLDEFFMVRVAGLKQQLQIGVVEQSADGMLPAEQLVAISERVHRMVELQYEVLNQHLLPALEAVGIRVLTQDNVNVEQRAAMKAYFHSSVFPALTPLAVDPAHPFPHLRNKSLNVALVVRRADRRRKKETAESSLAVVQVPIVLPRLVPLPAKSGQDYILLEQLISAHATDLFPGFVVEESGSFRVTRNWDLNLDEEEAEDLLWLIQQELRRRDRGNAVRLEVDHRVSASLEARLVSALKLSRSDVYRASGPLQLSDLTALSELDVRPEHHDEPFVPVVPSVFNDSESIFAALDRRDCLLHHPYESFDPVVRFLEEAADDPNVLAIKQTLYRTSGDSPIGRALVRASENGKQVAVLVELKARLDEANNIAWARRMEENGVHVVYGMVGLKTHSKVTLVVRRNAGGIKRYVHIGTGNYNPSTARQYTDFSLFTVRSEIADDVSALFNLLTGYSVEPHWKRLAVAPSTLQRTVLELIERETNKAKKKERALIRAKLNSLVDAKVIRALYEASQAGVEVLLNVRGICCLKPGVTGVSTGIRVISVVDRFLEHARVFAFGAEDAADVFISSADWMPRNFHRRIEVMCPVEDPVIKKRLLHEAFEIPLQDNVKARALQPDGTYLAVDAAGAAPFRSQSALLELARRVVSSTSP
jgi:polyphosphate kinase